MPTKVRVTEDAKYNYARAKKILESKWFQEAAIEIGQVGQTVLNWLESTPWGPHPNRPGVLSHPGWWGDRTGNLKASFVGTVNAVADSRDVWVNFINRAPHAHLVEGKRIKGRDLGNYWVTSGANYEMERRLDKHFGGTRIKHVVRT